MNTLPPFVVHVAAAPVGLTQTCACGWVLADAAPWAEGRVAVPDGSERDGPGWWPTGARVATDKATPTSGGMSYVLNPDDRPLADDERLCGATN